LNNPLAGLLGMVQLVRQMRAGSADAALLATAEEQALRCKDIVGKLLRFTGETKVGERERVDLAEIVRDVVGLSGSAFRQRDVSLELDAPASEVWVLAHPDELGRALSQILSALRAVAAAGSTLSVLVGKESGAINVVRVELRLDGVRDSEDDWRASALGLWAARQVLAAHEATLEEVKVQTGRCWRLQAPGLRS
jgi:signal transduction histidine kinase